MTKAAASIVFIALLSTAVARTSLSEEPAQPIPANYESLSGCEKQTELWSRVEASRYEKLPGFSGFGLWQLFRLGLQEIAKKGSTESDFAPKGWKKYLHRRAVMAKVKIVPVEGQPFTGVFQGAECGLLRLSLTYKPGKRAVAPGLALKVLRDAQPSANISALVSLDGQGKDYNFFANALSNVVPHGKSRGQRKVHSIFRKVTGYPEELLLTHLAEFDAAGQAPSAVVAPRQLFFVPNSELHFSPDQHDVREDLQTVPAGTKLYEIRSVPQTRADFDYSQYTDADSATFLAESEHVGNIVTTSEFVASEFGDDKIFFRHQLRP